MSLVGQFVVHKKWGSGLIESLTENAVSVRFDCDGVCRSFEFPNAFIRGYLKGATAKSASEIDRALEDRKCQCCGNPGVSTELISGKWLCVSCKTKFAVRCPTCGCYCDKNKMTAAFADRSTYTIINICEDCAKTKSFKCDHCGTRSLNSQRVTKAVSGKAYCVACFDYSTKVCNLCRSPFDIGTGATFFRRSESINVCPSCLKENTFRCSQCGSLELVAARVASKYISSDKGICDSCVEHCVVCNEAILFNPKKIAFGKHFCPECWDKVVISCNTCGEDFYPEDGCKNQCPDCVEMEAYKKRLLSSGALERPYDHIAYYQLEYVDRCKLFTKLYRCCTQSEDRLLLSGETELFNYLVMDFFNKRIVITYLPEEIKGNVRFSEDVTMTEFRSKKGRIGVLEAIRNWCDSSADCMNTTAGRMKILNYPVRLRVQTSYDKVYGKQWNGPNDYIEIGNYGDTTEFYVVGILEE